MQTTSFICLPLLRTSVFLTPPLIAVFRSPVLPSTSMFLTLFLTSLLRSAVLPSTVMFLTPFLASLLRSAVLPSSSQPPTNTCCHSQCHWRPPQATVLANSLLQGAVACHVTGLYPSHRVDCAKGETQTKPKGLLQGCRSRGLLNVTLQWEWGLTCDYCPKPRDLIHKESKPTCTTLLFVCS